MGVPGYLLPHTVTLVRPASVSDEYGNVKRDYGAAATRTVIKAWMQQDSGSENRSDGRESAVQNWLMVTNHADVQRFDRTEFNGITFEVEGPPKPASTPLAVHHTEATLRVVDG